MRFRDAAVLGSVALLAGGCSLIDATGDAVESTRGGYARSNIPNTSAAPRAVAIGNVGGSSSPDVAVLDELGMLRTCVNAGEAFFSCMQHSEVIGYDLVALLPPDTGGTDAIIVAATGKVDIYSFMSGSLVKRPLSVPAAFRPKKLGVGTFAASSKHAIVVTSADTPEIRIYLDPLSNAGAMTITTMNGNPTDAVVANVHSGPDAMGDELVVSEGGDIVTYSGAAFTRTARSVGGGSAVALAAGGFGSGGDSDIAWSHFSAGPGAIAVFHGSPTGLFDNGTRFAPGFSPDNLHATDLDGDGLDDVAGLYTELAGKRQLKRYFAAGGGFTEQSDLVLEGPARHVVFGDLDADSIDDILIVPGALGGVDVFRTGR